MISEMQKQPKLYTPSVDPCPIQKIWCSGTLLYNHAIIATTLLLRSLFVPRQKVSQTIFFFLNWTLIYGIANKKWHGKEKVTLFCSEIDFQIYFDSLLLPVAMYLLCFR